MQAWEAYAQVEPFGFDLLNAIQAHICYAQTAPWSKSKLKISDFLLDFGQKEIQQERPESIMAKLQALAQRKT